MPTPTRVGRSEDNPRSPATGDGSGATLLAQGHLVGRGRGIAQPPARKHLGVRRQPMRIQPRGAEDVAHVLPPSDQRVGDQDRKSTRLNSSHGYISYAVFCLKKKKTMERTLP